MENNAKTNRPGVAQSLIVLLCVIGVVVATIWMKVGIQIPLALGTCVAIIGALILGSKWDDIQNGIIKVVGESAVTLLILISVGMMVGIWIIGGTVPSLLYYGLKFCAPSFIIPITFLLTAITSIFTGTSYGAIATMGLALFGVGIGMGVPAPMLAGAVCAGSYFGDKMSPLSDTTNVAASMSGTDLYSHIGSMLRTTIPAAVVTLIIYTVLGLTSTTGTTDLSNVDLMANTLQGNFNITPLALIPALLVLVVSAKRLPAVPALLGCTAVSGLFAMLLQKTPITAVLNAAMNGHVSETGVELVDKILSRGGIVMMTGTIVVIILSATMGAVLEKSGIIETLVSDVMLKVVKKPKGLILSTMVYCYTLLLISGHQVMPIIMGGRTFRPAYDKMDLDSRVLSRTLEDTSTIGAPLVPWSASAMYMMSVLGVSTEYIPYAFLNYLVPCFAVLYACTGFFIWKKDGTALRGKSRIKVD